ncbi:MAG: ribonuclease J [Coriobacteriales bacterium]|nr:ribonuclease J [Coriobacteriales bacterium]
MSKKSQKPPLKIIPLGGLDGIGKNMTVIEYGDDMILDDAGLMFPDDNHPGVDLLLPDYTYVLENEHKLRGIIITHGHEDHTGALPYLIADLNPNVPIFSSKLTLGLIEGKFEEHNIKNPNFREIKAGDHIKLGCFDIDFFAVNHSIPDAMGVFISSPQGTVLHTGDFKLDQTPIDGVRTDYAALARFGEQGVDLLMSDSTNATHSGYTPSEAEVGKTLRDVINRAEGRVFVASFSSHVHRLQQICDAARDANRKVVVTGRSMITNTRIARELGYLDIDEEDLIDAFEIDKFPYNRVVVLCTGSQGEPLSALARMAAGEHRTLQIQEGDTVIISATPVPGNEKAVTDIINQLAKIGADVYDKSRCLVHVSGHGSEEELKLMMAFTKPTYIMPVHGEATHLRAHARIAQRMGIPESNIFVIENGNTLEMRSGVVALGEPVESGVVYVDGLRIGDTNRDVLLERKKLSEDGVILAVVRIHKKTGEVEEVSLMGRGVSFNASDSDFCEEATQRVKKSFSKHKATTLDHEERTKLAREVLTGYLWEAHHTRPMIMTHVMEA